jgi:hypothetical protein
VVILIFGLIICFYFAMFVGTAAGMRQNARDAEEKKQAKAKAEVEAELERRWREQVLTELRAQAAKD